MGCIITRTQEHTKHTTIWAEHYLFDELKRKNIPQVSNTLKQPKEAYTKLYSNTEPVALDMYISKANDGWKEENMTSIPEQMTTEQVRHQKIQPKTLCSEVEYRSLL